MRAAEQERETQRQQAEAVDNLRDILKKRNLAICVGSGVTLYSIKAADRPRLTWTGLVHNGFDYLERELPNFYQQQEKAFERARKLLDDDTATPGDLIDAASKLKSFFQSHPVKLADWLSLQFKELHRYVASPAVLESLKSLHRNGALLMTTNYDGLMEKYCGLSPLDSSDKDKLMEFNRRHCDGVFHPHGYWKNPKHIVLDAIDYYKVQHDDGVQETLRNIFTGRTILFVGCGGGLADPNFGELLKWLGEKEKNIGSSHYILLRKGELNPVPQLPLKHVRCEDYDAIGPWLEDLLDQSERSEGTSE
ncbi:SIR2-like domain-containing protein [Microdochium trichocladiopsis]|uniref:SIR2-like domain-containing protein n=1 Tax=Microdochium trichocladiopsis TaxID=1682393 RepID=A0A9P9BFC2_9PEZI|nr:SIR2-like domain-containing protein [Microdochium trichocladiopsis]KAH7010846.1 SIR2-like domain-containing protein [Microdochium trichocladiopsis]